MRIPGFDDEKHAALKQTLAEFLPHADFLNAWLKLDRSGSDIDSHVESAWAWAEKLEPHVDALYELWDLGARLQGGFKLLCLNAAYQNRAAWKAGFMKQDKNQRPSPDGDTLDRFLKHPDDDSKVIKLLAKGFKAQLDAFKKKRRQATLKANNPYVGASTKESSSLSSSSTSSSSDSSSDSDKKKKKKKKASKDSKKKRKDMKDKKEKKSKKIKKKSSSSATASDDNEKKTFTDSKEDNKKKQKKGNKSTKRETEDQEKAKASQKKKQKAPRNKNSGQKSKKVRKHKTERNSDQEKLPCKSVVPDFDDEDSWREIVAGVWEYWDAVNENWVHYGE